MPVHRRDLETENADHEREGYLAAYGHALRSVVDVPFAFGTLTANSERPDAFSADDFSGIRAGRTPRHD